MSKPAVTPRAWLMKSEPDVFSFADLRKRKSEPWSGVRNYQARNFMRDEMRVGDLVLFYHSSCEEPGVQGLGRVASKPYADPTQFDRKNESFEPRATKDKPVWWLVDVAWYADFARPVTLPMLRDEARLKSMVMLRPGNRLSITPVSATECSVIQRLGR
jgi:predicted RNA-binding protein with PUA-like domain